MRCRFTSDAAAVAGRRRRESGQVNRKEEEVEAKKKRFKWILARDSVASAHNVYLRLAQDVF